MDLVFDNIRRWRERPDIFVREVFGVTPDPKQDEVLRAFTKSPRIAMKASKGCGKDQPKSMYLDTPDGIKRWGSLKKGDRVFSVDGKPTTILETYDQGEKPLYRVSFDDGSFTICGLGHLWSVKGATERRKGQDWSTLTTEQIMNRGVRNKNGRWQGRQFEIPLHSAVEYPERKLPIDPYVLGVWLGDGSRATGSYTGIDDEVKSEIVSRGYTLGKEQYQTRTILGIRTLLLDLGILGDSSSERKVHHSYFHTSIKQRSDLLSGLLDTDGTIDKNGRIEFNSTSCQLAQDIIWLVRSLGGNACLSFKVKKPFYYDEDRNKICGKDCYRVTIRIPFNPFKIKRKADRYKPAVNDSQLRYFKRYIDSIEYVGKEESMCIEVDHPSHLYLCNDFIVTHNTCTEAWLAWNFLLTRPHPKIAATSISGDNLSDNLWTEMAHWQNKSKLLTEAFTWTKTRIFSNDHPETWWMSARTWPKSGDRAAQADTLAGLHADYIMFILDESGGIPDAVMASAEAALSTCIEGHLVQGGNPTHLEGPLYRACTAEKSLWYVVEMTGDPDDPNRSARVDIKWAKDQIAKYGRENPWVLVNVFGKFPPASFNALIGPNELHDAVSRRYKESDFSSAPRVLGIDVARFGDDSSVIFPRQGLQAFTPLQYRSVDGNTGAELTIRKWNEWQADGVFIDNTGGFGASWIDNMFRLGKDPIGVNFSQASVNPQYYNKRAEMAFSLVDWIKRGGALPDIPELIQALTVTTYTFHGEKLLIEPKEDIKIKLQGNSPDHMDALMLTFALPVEKKQTGLVFPQKSGNVFEYNPLSRDRVRPEQNTTEYVYDPRRL